jgi:hypothetical protein
VSPPKVTFNQEEFQLTLTGVGAGWSWRQFGSFQLFDQAQLQFPTSWSKFKISAATHAFDATWRLNSTLLIHQTLEAGVDYTLANGTGGSMSIDNELIQHLLDRPLVSMDAVLSVKLDGSADRQGFEGSANVGLMLRGRF